MIGYVGAIWQSSQIRFSLTITILSQTAKLRTDSGGEHKRITFLFTLEAKNGYAPHSSLFNLHQNHFSPALPSKSSRIISPKNEGVIRAKKIESKALSNHPWNSDIHRPRCVRIFT